MDLGLSSEGDIEAAILLFRKAVMDTDPKEPNPVINIRINVPNMFWAHCFTEFLNEAVNELERENLDPENKINVNVEVVEG